MKDTRGYSSSCVSSQQSRLIPNVCFFFSLPPHVSPELPLTLTGFKLETLVSPHKLHYYCCSVYVVHTFTQTLFKSCSSRLTLLYTFCAQQSAISSGVDVFLQT